MTTDVDGTANSVTKQGRRRGGFKPGQSGNPKGRPAGSRNKASLLLAELIDGEGEGIVRAMIQAAIAGDTSAGRCLIDRLVPPRKERPVQFALPHLETASDASKAMATITAGVAAGHLTPTEAIDLSKLITDFVKVIEVTELERRLTDIEARMGHGH